MKNSICQRRQRLAENFLRNRAHGRDQTGIRRNGEWKEINRHRNSIPDGIIPQAAADKVNEMYPDSFITKAEYDDGELDLKLDNGFELKFDKNFNLAGLDR